jgi:hypothetical protein
VKGYLTDQGVYYKNPIMKSKVVFFLLILVFGMQNSGCQENSLQYNPAVTDYVEALKDSLAVLSEKPGDEFFRMHCKAMLDVINSKYSLGGPDSAFLKSTFKAFYTSSDPANGLKMASFLLRKRPLILSWISPTDGAVSFSWLTLPKDWNPGNRYPLYVNLHGLWSVAANPIEYMTYPFLQSPSYSTAFEDGYLLSPWGRGNYWYKGIAETDIWECMAALEKVALADPDRKYLSGHSMGGYGAWSIASKSPDTWAALGIMAGALWYYPILLDDTIGQALKNVPTYFVCGTNDGLLDVNQTAYRLLQEAGNWHLQFVTFSGGHEYLEPNVRNMYLWMRQFTKSEIATDIIQTPAESQPGFLVSCNPNPVTTIANIVIGGYDNSAADIGIYDLCGRFVEDVGHQKRITGEQSIQYDTSGLKSGIYLVRVKSGSMATETKMVVIH